MRELQGVAMSKLFCLSLLSIVALSGCRTPHERLAMTMDRRGESLRSAILAAHLGNQPMTAAQIRAANPHMSDYEAAIMASIDKRWLSLLSDHNYSYEQGQVKVQFAVNADGMVSRVTIEQNQVGMAHALLCVSAVKDSSPFPPCPERMRSNMPLDYQMCLYTFEYH